MSRSVDYVSDSEEVIYFHLDCDEDEYFNPFQEVLENLQYGLRTRLPSIEACDSWEYGRELRTIAGNSLVDLVISEYCGLCSISVKVKQEGSYCGLAKKWAKQASKKIHEAVVEVAGFELTKIGRFSNGECVFEKKTA